MMNTPTQQEVDSIASFVEAVNELENEPFFSSDEPRRFSTCGDFQRFELGDRFHFRSALITFRRIWMNDDVESFNYVCNLLDCHLPEPDHSMLRAFRGDVKDAKQTRVQYPNVAIKGEDLINLWLNTVFAHSGLKGKKPTRQDFDQQIEIYGQGAMEYAFRHLVWMIGLSYRNVARLARPLLEQFKNINMHPSFQLGSAFGTKRRERTKDGHLIIRQSSSEHFSEETYEQRFLRIVKRTHFGNLKTILENLGFSDRNSLYLVLKYEEIAQIVEQSDLELQIVDVLDQPILTEGMRAYVGLYHISTNTNSSAAFTEVTMTTDNAGILIMNRLLRELRRELTNA